MLKYHHSKTSFWISGPYSDVQDGIRGHPRRPTAVTAPQGRPMLHITSNEPINLILPPRKVAGVLTIGDKGVLPTDGHHGTQWPSGAPTPTPRSPLGTHKLILPPEQAAGDPRKVEKVVLPSYGRQAAHLPPEHLQVTIVFIQDLVLPPERATGSLV